MAIFELLDRIEGLPPGVANGVVGQGEVIGEALAADPRVDKISFTGSSEVGRRLMELGARTSRVAIEGGGKAPVIVFPDANLEKAMDAVAVGIFLYAGQSCTAGSRLLLHRSIHDAFLDGLIAGRGRFASARRSTRDTARADGVGAPARAGPGLRRARSVRRPADPRRSARWRMVERLLHGPDDLR